MCILILQRDLTFVYAPRWKIQQMLEEHLDVQHLQMGTVCRILKILPV